MSEEMITGFIMGLIMAFFIWVIMSIIYESGLEKGRKAK